MCVRHVRMVQLPAPAWRNIVDVGCGTGLGTIAFADARAHHGLHNVRVLGVDSSSTQVATARESNGSDGVEYSVSLVTVVQAAHWFDLPPFFAECRRVLQPCGVLALITYSLPRVHVHSCALADAVINRAIEQVCAVIRVAHPVRAQLNDTLQHDGYWASERQLVRNSYKDLHLPFADVQELRNNETIAFTNPTNLRSFFDLFESWSGVRTYRDKVPDAPILKLFHERVRNAIPDSTDETPIDVIFPYFVLMGRNV